MVRKFLRGINVSLLLFIIIISTFSSCANELNVFEGDNNKQINFSVSVPQWKNTDSLSNSKSSRSTPIIDTSFGTDKSFNLIADQNDGTGNYSTLINSQAVSYTNNIWKTSNDYYWLGIANKTVNFYAYYPSTISNVSHTAGSSPTLSYTVPDNVSDQLDIMTATNNNVSGITNTSTPLNFNHIFAAVKFAVGTNGLPSGTIKSITINGIKNSGTYTFGSGWTLGSTTSSFTVSPSTTITGVAGANITSDIYTLMMIPQTFSNATVSLVYNNGTTFSKTISGTWNAGGVYTYNLSKTIVFNYNYTGASQSFTAPYTGTYKIECWGAQGGSSTNGRGGYASGYIYINKYTSFFIYIGGSGSSMGWNGGGYGLSAEGSYIFYGGGATDIRIINELGFNGIRSRIIIAGGGGGDSHGGTGGNGGNITGENGIPCETLSGGYAYGYGGSQIAGGSAGVFDWGGTGPTSGTFAEGGKGNSQYGGGGGGGYYGGGGSGVRAFSMGGGGGGSSFISGYPGCNAIDKLSTFDNIIHTGLPNHYSGYVFTNSQMIAGNASMPSPSGGTETGHTGNGYARITFVSAN